MAPTTTKTATPKAAPTAGVKKAGRPAGKSNKARTAMAQMQAYCKSLPFDACLTRYFTRLTLVRGMKLIITTVKENRSKYKDLDFKEQQKALGKEV
jgi:hypothetical protein